MLMARADSDSVVGNLKNRFGFERRPEIDTTPGSLGRKYFNGLWRRLEKFGGLFLGSRAPPVLSPASRLPCASLPELQVAN